MTRRKRRWILACGVALVVYAACGFLVVPWIAESQLGTRVRQALGREATVERVRFNPFTLVLALDGFRLADRDGEELARFDRLRVDFDVTGIFRRALRFEEILLDGPVVSVRILEDGRPSVADLLEPRPVTEPEEPFRLPRLIVDRLALSAGRIEFTDRSRQPTFESRFEPLSVEIRDLVTIPEESGDHSLTIGLGERAELRWTGRHTVEPLRFTGRFDVTGLDVGWLWQYLGHGHPLDLDGKVGVVLPYELQKPAGHGFAIAVDGASVSVQGFVAGPRRTGEEWLAVPEIEVRGIGILYPDRRVDVGGVRIVRPRALVRRGDDQQINWAVVVPRADADDAEAAPGDPAIVWNVRAATVEVEGASVRIEDRAVEPDLALEVADVGLRLDGVSSDLAAEVAFRAGARIGESGKLEASGTIAPQPLAARAEVNLEGLDLLVLHPYLQLLPNARVASGTTGARGTIEASGDPVGVRFAGTARADGVGLDGANGERLLSWERMGIEGIEAAHPPASARVRTITIEGAFAKVLIDRERNLNLARLRPTAPPDTAPAPAAPSPKVEIGSVLIRNAAIDFTDESLFLPFGTKIHGTNGAIRDLSTFAAAPATVALEGRVDETGSVKVDGVVRLADPLASTDLGVAFRHIEMNRLTPYSAEFAGYTIERGVLDLDIQYRLAARRLVGDHRVVASDLILGNKVEGGTSAGLPVRLAVALLKDKNGKIDLDVPVEGQVDSPEFAYRKVFWQAFKKILGNVATAPFRAIGRLFGRDEEDLELVEFDPGRSDLLPAELDKLPKLAAELAPRTELSIAVEGRFDPVSDPEALRRAKLEAAIDSRREAAAAAAAASGASTLETILEALFVERFSAEALEAERQKFLAAPVAAPPVPETPAKGKKKGATPPALPTPAAAEFDAAGFYEALRAKLLETETVTDAELADLARVRASAIRDTLCAEGLLDTARVRLLDPAPVKRKKAGSDRIASEMSMDADDR